jgi:uncharacterized protein (TIGR00730 family)
MRRICVYCGSSPGALPAYLEAAQALARALAARGIELVYGGGRVGLMGALADAVLGGGGRVIGVIPRALWDREVGHTGLTELRLVGSMHERKLLMADLADGFIALPGGMGTLEEFCEILTWSQLGLHQKPCGLLNIAGYYAPLLAFLDQMVDQGFLRPEYRALSLDDTDPDALLAQFEAYRPVPVTPWLNRSST